MPESVAEPAPPAATPAGVSPAATASMPEVAYEHSDVVWGQYEQSLLDLIDRTGAKRVLDIGGGASPTLAVGAIEARGLDCTVIDISAEELAKAPDAYRKVPADIAAADFKLPDVAAGERRGEFDLAFSKMLAEHVRDGRQFHRNVLKVLAPGGLAVHFFPTLYAPPFVVNRLMPETLSARVLDAVAPRDKVRKGKFPAYYQWCRGPTGRQIRRFEDLGYEVVKYTGYFGHPGYYRRLGPLKAIHDRITAGLLKNPRPGLTSYARVVLRKPAAP